MLRGSSLIDALFRKHNFILLPVNRAGGTPRDARSQTPVGASRSRPCRGVLQSGAVRSVFPPARLRPGRPRQRSFLYDRTAMHKSWCCPASRSGRSRRLSGGQCTPGACMIPDNRASRHTSCDGRGRPMHSGVWTRRRPGARCPRLCAAV